MSWAKLDDGFHHHPKVLAVGLAATGLYARALSWVASNETDGALPAAVVPALAAGEDAGPLTERLVASGLWDRAEGGFQVHDYLDFNPSRRDLQRNRKRIASRVRAYRARNAVTNDDESPPSPSTPGTGTGTGSSGSSSSSSESDAREDCARDEVARDPLPWGVLSRPGPIPEEIGPPPPEHDPAQKLALKDPGHTFALWRADRLAKRHERGLWTARWDLDYERWCLRQQEREREQQARRGPQAVDPERAARRAAMDRAVLGGGR